MSNAVTQGHFAAMKAKKREKVWGNEWNAGLSAATDVACGLRGLGGNLLADLLAS